MSIADIKKNTESKMAQSISALNGHLSKIRTGRANPALLDAYLEGAMLPALGKVGIRNTGVFTELDINKDTATYQYRDFISA